MQKVFPYNQTLSHKTFVMDRLTDEQTTDDNGNIDAYSTAAVPALESWRPPNTTLRPL